MTQYTRPRKPASHLIHLIESTKNHHPNFVLFLGAGASAESSVKTTTEMIREWRETYSSLYGQTDGAILEKQPWYDTPIEYSQLFEVLYDQPSQRREYIENCLESANPSWGYIYLVDLMRKGVFNTVFTTNFDDLLNEACYIYSKDVRPIVCAHDSSISSVRITTKRPKIIKLHGDFLFDSIKNTVRELESLEGNMREKLKQYSSEFGLIVLGYSGNDRSIMDTLDALLRNDGTFPHGVYWCVRKGSDVSSQVDHLCRFPRFHLVEIEGFNSFFSELYNAVSDKPHPIFVNPYSVAADKLGNLLGSLRAPSGKLEFQKCLARDVSLLGKSIQQVPPSVAIEMPHHILAWNDLVQGNVDGAIAHIRNDIKRGVTKEGVKLALDILKTNWNDGLADDLVSALEHNRFSRFYNVGNVNDVAVQLLLQGQFDYAERVLNATAKLFHMIGGAAKEYYLINQAQVFRHRNQKLPDAVVVKMREIVEHSADPLAKYGALVVLGEFSDAIKQLADNREANMVQKMPINDILAWPISKLLPVEIRDQLLDKPAKTEQNKAVHPSGGTAVVSDGESTAAAG